MKKMIDMTRAIIESALRVDFRLKTKVTIARMIRKKARKVKIKPKGSVQDKMTNRIPKTRIIIGKAILTKALFLVTFGL